MHGFFKYNGNISSELIPSFDFSNPAIPNEIEFKILKLLLSNKGRVFSIDEIYEKVWNEESFNVENTVAVHIRRIREKIEINPKEPRYLKVVWGVGYKLEKQ